MSVNESAVVVSSSASQHEDLEWGDEPKPNESSKKSKSKAKKNKKQTAAPAEGQTKESALPEEEPAAASTLAVAASTDVTNSSSSTASSVAPAGDETSSDAVTELPPPASLPHLTDITVQAASSSSSSSSDSNFASPPPSSISSSSSSAAAYDRRRVMPLESLPISKTPMFLAFRSSVQKQRCVVGNAVWVYFDLGPKDIAPLICICGTSGTAEMFFYQIMELGNKGFRVISVSPPAYYSHDDWVNGFNGFLAAMGFVDQSKKHVSAAASPSAAAEAKKGGNYVGKVHVFANSLAGHMCLYYLSHIIPSRNHIASLILCNSFLDTLHYQKQNGNNNWCIALLKKAPAFIVRKYVLDSMPETTLYPESVDFMIEQFEENLPNDVLASRLILNILRNRGVTDVNSWKTAEGETFPQSNITIMDTSDESVIPSAMRERLYEALPNARYATLKFGGDLPFLSCPDEVNMHLQVHLRQFGIFPSLRKISNPSKNEGEDEIPPAVVLSSLPADIHLNHRTLSKPASAVPSVSSSPATGGVGTVFLTPGFSLPEKKPKNAQKLGYGNEDEDDENDSIFLTSKPTRKNSTSEIAGAAPASDSTLAMARPDGRKQEDPELSERSAIMAQIQAEAAASASSANRDHDGGHSAAFIAQREQERSAREAASAREIEKIQAEQLKQQKQEEALNSLLDEAAIEDEQRLTKKKPIKKFDSEDLF